MKIIKSISLFVLLMVSCLNSRSQTGVVIVDLVQKASIKCSSDSNSVQISYVIRPDILRVNLNGPFHNLSMIYQPSSEKVWVLQHRLKQYKVLIPSDIEFFSEQISVVSKIMIEKHNENQSDSNSIEIWPGGNPFNMEKPEFILQKKKDSLISQLLCKRYDGKLSNGQVKTNYIHSLKGTGIDDEELEILGEFSGFVGESLRMLSGKLDFAGFKKLDLKGYPILTEFKGGNTVCNYMLVKSIHRDVKKDIYFSIPFDYLLTEN